MASKVRYFHQAFGLPSPDVPTLPDADLVALRARLIREEYLEAKEEIDALLYALRAGRSAADIVPIMQRLNKELTDLRYVVEGAQLSWGCEPDDLMRDVHLSNMSKLDSDGKPIYDAQGKVLKGPRYMPVSPHQMYPGVYEMEEYHGTD